MLRHAEQVPPIEPPLTLRTSQHVVAVEGSFLGAGSALKHFKLAHQGLRLTALRGRASW
jgi:hypothetical protein